jgi:hypothetical protein
MNTSFIQKWRTINNNLNIKFEVFIAVLIKIHVFWDVMPYRLLHNYLDCLNLNMEAICSTNMLVTMCKLTNFNIPEDRNLQKLLCNHWLLLDSVSCHVHIYTFFQVVYVARNPKDVAVSFYHLNKLIRTQGYLGDFPRYWDYFEKNLRE